MDASLAEKLTLFLVLIASLSVHEWAHAWVADKLGDDTPRSQGRVTLNPIAHIDLLGTIILPLTMILLAPGFAILGWGRPVIINPRNFKNPMWGDIQATLAGPLSNLLLALLAAVVFGLWAGSTSDTAMVEKVMTLGYSIVYINCLLAVFNLLPIPPLDGSHVARYIFRISELQFIQFAQWGALVLLVLINIPIFRMLLGGAVMLASAPFQDIMQLAAMTVSGGGLR